MPMKSNLFLAVLLPLLFSVGSFAQDDFSAAMSEMSKKVSFFHENPTDENFQEIAKTIDRWKDELEGLDKRRGFQSILSTFVARVHEKYDYEIEGDNSINQLAKEILNPETKNEDAKFIQNDELITRQKLDLWWSSFYATGEDKYLQLLLARTGSKEMIQEAQQANNTTLANIMGAASWSFASNLNQQEAVQNFAKAMLENEDMEAKHEFLKDCLDKVEADK